ncbi:MAG: DUF2309 domain-containing protein [Pirellulales bacterium]
MSATSINKTGTELAGPGAIPSGLAEAIERAVHLLPMQGPITSFIHHNTLHAFEQLPFHDAVLAGAELYSCEPYLPEEAFRRELARGRIRVADLSAIVQADLGEEADTPLLLLCTRRQLRMAMLEHSLLSAPASELRWFVAQADALRRFRADAPADQRRSCIEQTRHWIVRDLLPSIRRDPMNSSNGTPEHQRAAGLLRDLDPAAVDEWGDTQWEAFTLKTLWRICRAGVHGLAHAAPAEARQRHRDALLRATGEDTDLLVNEMLIPFCAAFLDQGLARWLLPERETGFIRTFQLLHGQSDSKLRPWMRELPEELQRWEQHGWTAMAAIHDSLRQMGVHEDEWPAFLTRTLLALRGWAGMLKQMELRQETAEHPAPAGTIVEFLAIRLLLDRLAAQDVARRLLRDELPVSQLRAKRPIGPSETELTLDQRAFPVFQLAQILGWLPMDLYRLSKSQWAALVSEVEQFSGLERRRVFQAAYERKYRIEVLDAISAHGPFPPTSKLAGRFQAVFCLDEREESFVRHLEEVAPAVEAFGTAGFFGVAMYYRGVADAHFCTLCPVIIQPQHWVAEEALSAVEGLNQRRAKARRLLGGTSHRLHVGSRGFLGGAIAAAFGVVASLPLVARVLFPRSTARLRRHVDQMVAPPRSTRLRLERVDEKPSRVGGGIGYALPEMTVIVERLLRNIGLTSQYAPLVFIVGHGSSSLNNPHEPAHDCGACGGARGGPNARAFAQMANDPRVRLALRERGLSIPSSTHFIGAYHNTCDESFTCFDLSDVPASHGDALKSALESFRVAQERNAHERCRRFDSASLSLSPEQALWHVEGRSEDLAQTRPEYGHATNAVCFVGRRQRTRGLYLDRRTFLTSYDPTQDDAESSILAGLLSAVVPVCAGINLEYYFSRVDPGGWGCGTKLPHNITSLLGVMDGAMSDMRPGLPWQMVEIHEPVRLLFVMEATPAAMLSIMSRNEDIGRLCRNHWVQLATLDPQSNALHVFDGREFVKYRPEKPLLPRVASSVDWYRGWRDHLGFAVVEKGG